MNEVVGVRGEQVVGEPSLSLTGELLLLAIDPGPGGLFPHDRRRFRRALAATHRPESGGGGFLQGPRRARRSAIAELERAALVADGSLHLIDRTEAAGHFRRVRLCIEGDEAADARDWVLLLLLAWCGVLRHRLAKHERRLPFRRLRQLVRSAGDDAAWQPPGEPRQALPASIGNLGGILAVWEGIDLFETPGMTDFGREASGFRPF